MQTMYLVPFNRDAHHLPRLTLQGVFFSLPAVVQPAVAADGEGFLCDGLITLVFLASALDGERFFLDLELEFDLGFGRTLRLALDPLGTRRSRARRFARRPVASPLAVTATGSHRAVVFHLAVGAGVELHTVGFPLAVRAGVAVRAVAFRLPVRAGGALCAVVFPLAVRAGGAALSAPDFHLAVRAGGAYSAAALPPAVGAAVAVRAAAFHLAVRTGVACHTVAFQLPVRAGVAGRALAFQLAVGARVARRAEAFHLAVRAGVHVAQSPSAFPCGYRFRSPILTRDDPRACRFLCGHDGVVAFREARFSVVPRIPIFSKVRRRTHAIAILPTLLPARASGRSLHYATWHGDAAKCAERATCRFGFR